MMTTLLFINKIRAYAQLIRWHRPIGSLLLLWPTLWALWTAAQGFPDWRILLVFIVGVVVMRSAGCVINDIADRHVDGHVARTKDRPLVTGKLTVREAMGALIALLCCAFVLVLTLNRLTILLAFVGLGLAMLYPFTKRFTHFAQFFLGAAFAWSVPMAFAAQTEALPPIAWLLFAIALLWPVIYDTMYAMVDRPDDLRIGVKSTAILFGQADRAVLGVLQGVLLVLLALLGHLMQWSHYYFIALGIAAVLAIYQQFLLKDRLPDLCFKAFLNNNWFGLIIFLGICLG